MVQNLEVAVGFRIPGSSVGTQRSKENHAVKALLKSHDFIEKGFRLGRDTHRGASIREVFFRFRHVLSISGVFVIFVFISIFMLTQSTIVD